VNIKFRCASDHHLLERIKTIISENFSSADCDVLKAITHNDGVPTTYAVNIDKKWYFCKVSRHLIKSESTADDVIPAVESFSGGAHKANGWILPLYSFLNSKAQEYLHKWDVRRYCVSRWKSDQIKSGYREDLVVEKSVLLAWRKGGVNCPQVVAGDNELLVMEYIEGYAYRDIQKNGFDKGLYERACEQVFRVQAVATEIGDFRYLFMDPNVTNLLVGRNDVVYLVDANGCSIAEKKDKRRLVKAFYRKYKVHNMKAISNISFMRTHKQSLLLEEDFLECLKIFLRQVPIHDLRRIIFVCAPKISMLYCYYQLQHYLTAVMRGQSQRSWKNPARKYLNAKYSEIYSLGKLELQKRNGKIM
jgi:tRNA A-37 threonylcarbamoyl transferase component Bud32